MTKKYSLRSFIASYPWGHHALCLLPLCITLIVVAVTTGTGIDTARYFMALRPTQPNLTIIMTAITYTAAPIFYGIYAYILWRGYKDANPRLVRLAVAYLLVQVIISLLLVRFFKIAVGKPRPMAFLKGEGYVPFTFGHGNHSFPSGHTSEIIGSTLPLALRRKRLALTITMGCIIALVGFSRIYLSMHHISDIVAGMAFGSVCGFLIHYISTGRDYEHRQ